jgi:transcriptional regulator with XRE-family HTH domain
MDNSHADIHDRLAARLRGLRAERDLTLDGLAERAGVSRSMISLIERGESSPTAAVLDRLASPIELVEVVLPAGARVAYDSAMPRAVAISQQLWVLEGRLELTVGEATHHLDAGDCLAMRLDAPIAFRNATDADTRYVVALAADSRPGAGGGTIHRGIVP